MNGEPGPPKLTQSTDGKYLFWCVGCFMMHAYDKRWTFNDDFEKPTFSPSLLTTYPVGGVEKRCHLFMKDGYVEFLNDCDHEYAGMKVALRQIPEGA